MPTFDQFWQRYPRKVARLRAEKTWAKLKPADQAAALAAIDAHAEYWIDYRDAEHIPHAATWLADERWTDELYANPRLDFVRKHGYRSPHA